MLRSSRPSSRYLHSLPRSVGFWDRHIHSGSPFSHPLQLSTAFCIELFSLSRKSGSRGMEFTNTSTFPPRSSRPVTQTQDSTLVHQLPHRQRPIRTKQSIAHHSPVAPSSRVLESIAAVLLTRSTVAVLTGFPCLSAVLTIPALTAE